MLNMLSVDVEDYHQLMYRNMLGVQIPPTDQVVESTLRILHVLRECGTRATFFVVGNVAERFPELVQSIAEAGHEVATHGYAHRFISDMTPDEFSIDLSLSLSVLRELSGQKVVGHRAPRYSVAADCSWAFKILVQHGINYDSSLPFVSHGHAQLPSASHIAYEIEPSLIEVPLSALELGRVRLPLGGSYIRLLPYDFTRRAIRHINRKDLPVVVYLHPYEFDTAPAPFDFAGVPVAQRVKVGLLHWQYRINRSRSETRLRAMLSEFSFACILDSLGNAGIQV